MDHASKPFDKRNTKASIFKNLYNDYMLYNVSIKPIIKSCVIYYCFLLHLVKINVVIFSLKIGLNKQYHSQTVFLSTMKFNYKSRAESLSEIPIYTKWINCVPKHEGHFRCKPVYSLPAFRRRSLPHIWGGDTPVTCHLISNFKCSFS